MKPNLFAWNGNGKKKLKRLRKVFVVTLRDNETQSTEVITAVSRNGWFYLS
mgnify:CR=1 FL=1